MPVTTAYLDTLNSEQRRAVEHGVAEFERSSGGPLLAIAGAGSGKTNTLAHRVAHLIVNGADPRRILLMTFSRRGAAEMTKRVERISRKAMGDKAEVLRVSVVRPKPGSSKRAVARTLSALLTGGSCPCRINTARNKAAKLARLSLIKANSFSTEVDAGIYRRRS